ncbi:MAG: glycosyltransferase [Gemmatimonadetes bacterium]|nr:glycosyltransferase [Gemmatimonadota bacterium]
MPTKKLRVMHVTEDLGVGGLERVVATLCDTVDPDRFESSVLCLRELGAFADDLRARGFPVFLLDQTPGRTNYLSFMKVARLLREQRVDVVHSHNTHAFIDGGLGAALSGVKTIVHTDHARSFPDKRRYMVAEHVLSHLVYKIVGVSEHTSANLIRHERISPRKLTTIPNGIDGSRYAAAVDLPAKRRELGITREGPVIGLGARLMEQKGVEYLLRALPAIVSRFPGLTLVVAGEGPLEAPLKQLASELGMDGHVRFVGVRLDLAELLHLFDLFVLPSIWEGLPMVLLEALAAGCPVVATDVGGVGTAIEDGVNGSLVPPRDPDALAAAVSALLADPALRDRYREAGRAVFRERFSAQAMARRYEALYSRQSN